MKKFFSRTFIVVRGKIKKNQNILEANFQKLRPQTYKYPLLSYFILRFAALISDAEAAMAASADRLVELDAMIAEAQNNRTDENTTVAEILERHPDIAAEIKEEIKEDKWFSN